LFLEKKKKNLGHQYQQEAEIGYYILSSHNLNVRQSCKQTHTHTQTTSTTTFYKLVTIDSSSMKPLMSERK